MKATSIFCRFLVTVFLFVPRVSFTQTGTTMSNPIIMGSYGGGSFTYNDSRSSAGYGNEYGQPSEDIFYRFTVTGSAEISVSTCAADIDTYLYLLKNDGSLLEQSNDNGPVCAGSRASIKTSLPAGTYHLVTEGYGAASGVIPLSVSLVVETPSSLVSGETRNFTKVWEALSPRRGEWRIPRSTTV